MTNETVTGSAPTGNLGYGYDPVGNRTNRSGNLLGGSQDQTPTYNTNDWLTTDNYDNNGNTLWSTNGTAQGPNSYDPENRLTSFNNGAVVIAYNGDGARVKKTAGTTTTYYLTDDRNPSGYVQVLEEHQSVNGGAVTNNRVFNYGLDLISQREAGGTVYYFGYDGHGSTRFLTGSSGGVSNVFVYDAYGTLIGSNTTAQTAYLYCGEQFDGNLGFYYLRARYLNPTTGRFWTMDSYEGSQSDPLSLHKYVYCSDNAVNIIDPLGRDGVGELIGGGISGLASPVVGQIYKYVRKGMISADDTKPQLPDLNSPYLTANHHSMVIYNSPATVDEIFTQLSRINVSGATAENLPVAAVGQRIKWRITDPLAYLGQDSFYVTVTKYVNNSGKEGPNDHFFCVVAASRVVHVKGSITFAEDW